MAYGDPLRPEAGSCEDDQNRDDQDSDGLNSAEDRPRPSQVFGQKRRRVTRACDEVLWSSALEENVS